jgi:cell division protein FtsQ
MTRQPAGVASRGRPATRHRSADRPASRSTVSKTSAQRFAARVRSRRRRRILIGLGVAVLLAGAAWALLASPWATARRIEVAGLHRVDAAAVRAAARPELGRPLLLADTGRIAAQVRRQPLVAAVEVSRRWPSTLQVTVRERNPVAAVPGPNGVRLVDVDGVVVDLAMLPPPNLPLVEVEVGTPGSAEASDPSANPATSPLPGAAALRACLAVLEGMPAGLRAQVHQIGADGPESVWLVLNDRSRVQWGGAERTPLKAQVLQALRRQRAARYDVSAPDAPAVSGRLR